MPYHPPIPSRLSAPLLALGLSLALAGFGCEERPEVDPPAVTETDEEIQEHIPHTTLPGDSEGETMVPVAREPGDE